MSGQSGQDSHGTVGTAARDALEEAVHALPAWAESCGFEPVDAVTLATALAFVRAIPTGWALPRVASDEDGCVLLGWPGAGALSVTVDGGTLHVTARPGASSGHLPPVAYGGGALPDAVCSLLPASS